MFLYKMLQLFSVILILAVSLGYAGNNNDADQSSAGTNTKQRTYVDNVRQNYNTTINQLLEQQIVRELDASYLYQAYMGEVNVKRLEHDNVMDTCYASYFQRADVNLPGIQKFFAKASAEEKQHGQALIEYMNKRGGHVTFDDIDLIYTCNVVKANADGFYVGGNENSRMCICSFVWPRDTLRGCPDRDEWKNGLFAFTDALAVERFVNFHLLKLHQAAEDANDAHLAHFLEHDFLEEQVNAIYELGQFVTRLTSFDKGDGYNLGEYLFDQKLQ